jgi:hypothetical protein
MSGNAVEKPPVEVVKRLSQLPPLKVKASPRDGDLWLQRLEEEYTCLIKVPHKCSLLHFSPSLIIPKLSRKATRSAL